MQASREWVPPSGTLGEILAETRERVASIEWELEGRAVTVPARPGLRRALQRADVAVIAEIKRRSPSRGDLDPGMSAADQSRRFERGGAAAISVLTEPNRFGGSTADLASAAAHTRLPLLRKDFHVSPRQLTEAVAHQASAVLLIARALRPRHLSDMMQSAAHLGLETVVEIRTEDELALALELKATMIGVNSRNLETLEVDESVPARLVPRIPADCVAIWESGVGSVADVQRAAAAGADAVLVGSALSTARDPEAMLRGLTGVARKGRG